MRSACTIMVAQQSLSCHCAYMLRYISSTILGEPLKRRKLTTTAVPSEHLGHAKRIGMTEDSTRTKRVAKRQRSNVSIPDLQLGAEAVVGK